MAASIAPLAMLWPRMGASISHTSLAEANSLPQSAGQMKSRSISQAVSMVSGEYEGRSPATHSPQPMAPSTFTSTRRMRRTVVRPKLVSNGRTSGI